MWFVTNDIDSHGQTFNVYKDKGVKTVRYGLEMVFNALVT